jgi:hypothetical protein
MHAYPRMGVGNLKSRPMRLEVGVVSALLRHFVCHCCLGTDRVYIGLLVDKLPVFITVTHGKDLNKSTFHAVPTLLYYASR